MEIEKSLADLLLPSSSSGPTAFAPELATHIIHLTSLPLNELLAEPAKLRSEESQLVHSLASLCHAEYGTFLSLKDAEGRLQGSVESVMDGLANILGDQPNVDTDVQLNNQGALPSLESRIKSFTALTSPLKSSRLQATLLLTHQDTLLTLLSLPTLVDTCVRNGYYHEALQLRTHARDVLLARFGDVEVVKGIVEEVEDCVWAMRDVLIKGLGERGAKLPGLFRAVGVLRKMGAFETRKSDVNGEGSHSAEEAELHLALVFLISRLDNINGVLADIQRDKSDLARYLRRYVDAWREGVYDIVSQFTTIFLERSHTHPHPPTSAKSPSTPTQPPPSATTTSLHANLTNLLSTLTHHTLYTHLLPTLRHIVPQIHDASSLSSLLTQLTYCASAFARIGVDFRAVIGRTFENAVTDIFKNAVNGACEAFVKIVEGAKSEGKKAATWAFVQSSTNLSSISSSNLPSEHLYTSWRTSPPHVPPPVLTSFPPLVTYTNALLTALNGLRLLAPLSIQDKLLKILDETLERASEALVKCLDDTSATSTTVDRNAKDDDVVIARTLIRAFRLALVPYIRRALLVGIYAMEDYEHEDEKNRRDGMSDGLRGALNRLKICEARGVEGVEEAPHDNP